MNAIRSLESFRNKKIFFNLNFFLILILLASLTGFLSCNNEIKEKNLVLVCGDSKVLLTKAAANSQDTVPDIIWSWDAHTATNLPPLFNPKKFNTIDDCKAINGGKQILVSSSSGAVAMINKDDKKILFYAEVPNAHSIELLPDNKLVAAASTANNGNRLMLFEIANPAKLLFSDSLYSAHGVIWDKNRNSLFALGYKTLREYKRNNNQLSLLEEWKIPGISGHDLQMLPDGKHLFVTEHTGAWIFDIESKKFSKIDGFPDKENIKSINQNKEGRYVFTIPEESWWTYHVKFLNPEGNLSFPEMHVYKARWFQ
ncbi:DUF6528 family protein [Maribellus maritimus]|uniref:DUF6528 family protein n=1 Tax=Maribellus maritimus TaxID=2870838 RepID=UPI001EEA4F4A|nr:DUF6528 family protein [Maribellus maritimus]MCG6191003.1 DUF6528 family protein [Maribellus maritimus]